MLGNATTTSTNNKHRRPKIEALVSRSKIVPKPAVVTSQPPGKCVVAQNSIAHQSSKAASTYGHDVKWGGNDDYYPTSVASLQTLVDAQISITFQDDLTKPCTYARGDSQHRIFFLRKEGPDWTRSRCTESFMPAPQINDRVKRGPTKSRQKKQNIKWTLEKLEPRRRSTSEHLLQEVNRCDPHGYKWCIVAIDNEDPMFTKRTKEVAVFSVILAKASDDPTSR
ncbi:hypothetical protein LTS08_003341 [Lithohypha guttulata]|nr:hypothetical protein LTS08_003341 [Lithohypha guttulata]